MMKPELSICIVNWNTAALLKECLQSIYQHPPSMPFEVIVVDNGSRDGSVAMVQREFPQARVLAQTENLGFARANNLAFAHAKGAFLLLLNSDTVVPPGAIDALWRFAQQHPRAGIVGPRIQSPDGKLQYSCRAFPTLTILLWRALYLDKLLPHNRWAGANYQTFAGYDRAREVDWLQGSCLLVRREVLDTVGGLDSGFFMYAEDMDWCYRARRAGWHVWYTPEATIVHYGGQSSQQRPAAMLIAYYQSLLRYFDKHHGHVACGVARFLALLEVSFRIPYWLWRRVRSKGGAGRAATRLRALGAAWLWLLMGLRYERMLRETRTLSGAE